MSVTRSGLLVFLWSITAAFGSYFCMYTFRKPFTAADYQGTFFGIDFKTILVTAQVAGYMLSKFIGIKVIAEMPPALRGRVFVVLIAIAWLALLLFALIPVPYNTACLFLNGLPLGMVFGLVLGFLEGRRVTEALTAGLCASFIVADGVAKSVGAWLLDLGIGEYWMPFAAGGVFLLPQLGFVWMLTHVQPPTGNDRQRRGERIVMTRADRSRLFWRYAIGFSLIIVAYLLVTILRSIRADFAPNLWLALEYQVDASLFTVTEMLVAFGVVVVNGTVVLIDDNRRAFFAAMGASLVGLLLIPIALLLRAQMGPFAYVVLIGLGLYVPYVAVHTTLFERLLALLRERGNLGYLMYLADAFGYLGYVAVMVVRNFLPYRGDFLAFFDAACWVVAVGSSTALALACFYFLACGAAQDKATRG